MVCYAFCTQRMRGQLCRGRRRQNADAVDEDVSAGSVGQLFIAMGGAVTNTAAHTIDNVGIARIVCGLFANTNLRSSESTAETRIGWRKRFWGCLPVG